MDTKLLTPEEVADRLRISRITVMNHLRSGTLKGVKIGRLWRISEEALAAFCSPSSHNLTDGTYTDDIDSRWQASYWEGRDRPLGEYDWGPQGMPAVKPVRYVPGKGLVIEGGKRDESE